MAPTKKSPIWDYFEEEKNDPTTALCQVSNCKTKVSRGKSGSSKSNLSNAPLTSHLKVHHPKEYSHLMQKKNEIEINAAEKRKEMEEEDEMEGGTIPLFKLRTKMQRKEFLVQSKVSSWVKGAGTSKPGNVYDIHDARAKEKHKGILMMVILDLQPWSMVNDPGFLYFSNQMDPHYHVASDKFYRGLLDKAYKKSVTKVEEKLERDAPEYVSCQLDGWSAYRHGYIGLLVNYISPAWKRVSLCLACGSYDTNHTGAKLGDWLENKLEQWKVLDKTTVTVSDTAANMIKMFEFLPQHIVHNGCLNHVLQLVINDEILEKPEVKNIVYNVRAFTNYAAFPLLNAAMRSKQEEMGKDESEIKTLIQDVKTRWNSTHDMLERFVELQEAIKKVLEMEEWKGKIVVKTGNLAGTAVKFSNNDWKVMERVVKLLSPFKEATLKLLSASACISQAIPTISSLLHTLKPAYNINTDLGVRDLKRRLSTNLVERLDFTEDSEIHAVATLLDPRYKNCFFRSGDAKKNAEGKLLQLLRSEVDAGPISRQSSLEMVDDPAQCDGLEAAFLAVQQHVRRDEGGEVKESEEDILKRYLNSKLEKSCLNWWRDFEEKGKNCKISQALCRLARQFLTPPPTSTDCERLFSVAGQVMDEKRAKLLPDNLDKILFLRENILVTNCNLDW